MTPPEPLLPPSLRAGDLVAIVSPSADLASRYPIRMAAGCRALEAMGFRTRVMPHAAATGDRFGVPEADRIADLEEAFADAEVRGIICAIGGWGASRLLDRLDYDIVRRNPTVFCGYSDTTVLHAAFRRETGLVTFYGPSLLMELGDHPAPFPETVAGLLRATGDGGIGAIPALPTLVTEGTDWNAPHQRHREPAPQPRLLRGGAGRGPLAGGCLPRVTSLIGTRWQIPTAGRILFLETPQAPFTPDQALDHLWHLRHAAMLDDLAGLVMGWPFTLDQVDDLETALRLAVPANSEYPVLFGRPFGHTSPFLTLPIGVDAVLDGHDFRVVGRASTPR